MHDNIFVSFTGEQSEPKLSVLLLSLYAQQKSSWPKLATAIEALDHVRIRDLQCSGFKVKLQFNPARIVSTGASIDPESIKKRSCFLCVSHLPEQQKGILYRQTFLILCNPFPIVKQHYTISHVHHIPQSFSANVDSFLRLAEDLAPDFNVFYNGPCAGASAPDHLHFQASPANILPIEKKLWENSARQFLKSLDGISLFAMDIPGRRVIIFEGKSIDGLAAAVMTVTEKLKLLIPTADEPIMNIICSYREHTWRLVMFLRRKHRPDVYYMKGVERILISPGMMEMGGLVITPVEKDFIKVNAETIKNIYEEISLDPQIVRQVIDAV